MTTKSTSWQDILTLVEKLSWSDQLHLISELLLRRRTSTPEVEPIDLLTLAGVGSEVWSNLDVNTYLNQERDNWQN